MFTIVNALIIAVKDLFEALFFSSSPEYQKKRQLKTALTELKNMKPPLYRTGNILLPAFGVFLYELYYFLQPVKNLLDKTICSLDIRVSEKYQVLFFEAILTEEQTKQWQSFTFEARKRILSACKTTQETDRVLQEQTHNFKNFITLFQTDPFKKREQTLAELFFLSDLCNFDYASFLSRFNSRVPLTTGEPVSISQDDFEEVFANDAVKNLLDFNFIVRHITITQDIINAVISLGRTTESFTDGGANKLEKALVTVENILTYRLKRSAIPLILKLIKDDPSFEENITISEVKPLKEYISQTNERFFAESKRLLKLAKEMHITALIEKYFGTAPLPSLEGYNDTVNDAIQSLSPASFDWVRPMQLLKVFTIKYFETDYKVFLKSLLIEGFFANKQIESQYAAIYRACELLTGTIKNFEALFKPQGQCNILEIKGYIAEIEKGKDMRKQLQKLVAIANMQAKIIVQNGSKTYADLYTFTEHILDDIKAHTPELIINIRALAGSSKNKESFAHIEQDRHIFTHFLDIMKNYAAIGSLENGKPASILPPTAAASHGLAAATAITTATAGISSSAEPTTPSPEKQTALQKA